MEGGKDRWNDEEDGEMLGYLASPMFSSNPLGGTKRPLAWLGLRAAALGSSARPQAFPPALSGWRAQPYLAFPLELSRVVLHLLALSSLSPPPPVPVSE